MKWLYPDCLRPSVTDVTADDLRALGVRGLLLDVDNTLTGHGSQQLTPEVSAWLDTMQRQGIAMTVVSNGLSCRVRPFAKKVGLRWIAPACKPMPFGFWKGARRLGLSRRECAAVGDQIFTDVMGARLAGVRCVLLMPIAPEHSPLFRLKRWLEGFVLRRYRRQTEEGEGRREQDGQ